MSGNSFAPAVTGAILAFAGASIAQAGWRGLRRPAASPGADGAPAAPAAGAPSLGWKIFFVAVLLLGAFVFVCGLLLALSPFLSE